MSAIQSSPGRPTVTTSPFPFKEPIRVPHTVRPLSIEYNRFVEENKAAFETKHPQAAKQTYIESNALTKEAAERVLVHLNGYYDGSIVACRTVKNLGKYRVRLVSEDLAPKALKAGIPAHSQVRVSLVPKEIAVKANEATIGPLPLQVVNNVDQFLRYFHQLITLKGIHNQDHWNEKMMEFPKEHRDVKEIIDYIFKPFRCSIISHEPHLGNYDPETDSYALVLKKYQYLKGSELDVTSPTSHRNSSEKGCIGYIRKIPKALIQEWAEFYNLEENPKYERAMSFRVKISRSPGMNVLDTLTHRTAVRVHPISHPPALDTTLIRFPSSSHPLSPLSPPPLLRQNAIYYENVERHIE